MAALLPSFARLISRVQVTTPAAFLCGPKKIASEVMLSLESSVSGGFCWVDVSWGWGGFMRAPGVLGSSKSLV